MPIIKSTYKAPFYYFNGHLQTILPSVFRKVQLDGMVRERLELPDDDFVDIDLLRKGNKRIAILTHGLEGNSTRTYILGMAKILSEQGFDICAWNCRSCSGEMNRQMRMYNHAEIGDIGEVIKHCISIGYEDISLIGFSMGGSITLNYLGNHGHNIPSQVKKGVAISAPCDLVSSVGLLNKRSNYLYKKKFLDRLSAKMIEKDKRFPGVIDLNNLKKIKKWEDFDVYFSSPINSFKSPQDFYERASAINTMHQISVPTYILTALNDPLLSEACYPYKLAEENDNLHLEVTKTGGHIGYSLHNEEYTYSEKQTLIFLNNH